MTENESKRWNDTWNAIEKGRGRERGRGHKLAHKKKKE